MPNQQRDPRRETIHTDWRLDEVMSATTINHLDDQSRRKAFRLLVTRQDRGETVATSRLRVSQQFNIGYRQLLGIEREGLEKQWPPLSKKDSR